jgi:hypothetical protein
VSGYTTRTQSGTKASGNPLFLLGGRRFLVSLGVISEYIALRNGMEEVIGSIPIRSTNQLIASR